MKAILFCTLLFLILIPNTLGSKSKKKPALDPTKCNKTLMDSYDIEGVWDPVKDRNLICPMANKHNCCNYHGQLDIYKKWIMQGEGRKIRELYKTYAKAIGKNAFRSNSQRWFSIDSSKLSN